MLSKRYIGGAFAGLERALENEEKARISWPPKMALEDSLKLDREIDDQMKPLT